MASGAKTPAIVGYGRRPVEHQFEKGTSCNPGGRPRKQRQTATTASSSIDDLVRAEVYRTIAVRENNKEVHLPAIQIALRSLALQAAKGSTRAQLAMAKLLTEADQRASDRIIANVTAVLEYQMGCEEEFRRCDEAGKPRPETIPHPDEIAILPHTGKIIFNGPSDKREKAKWDKLIKARDDFAAENDILKKERRRAKTDAQRELYDREIQINQRIIGIADQTFPSEKMRRAPDFNIHEWRLKQPLLQAEIAKRNKRRAKPTSRR